jgi:cell division protein FtsL
MARATHLGQVDRRAPIAPLGAIIDTSGRRGIGVGAFVLALVTAGALVHVGVRMKGIEVAYDLGREKRVNTQLEEERRRLNIEIGMLKDPVRVVAIARDKLKMGPPAQSDVVRLAPGQVLGARPAADVEAPAKHARAAATPANAHVGAPRAAKARRAAEAAAAPSAEEAPTEAPIKSEKTETKGEAASPAREADE